MKPRIFWTMLLAFALTIVLGVCGMLTFFGLAVAGIVRPPELPNQSGRFGSFQGAQDAYVETLADYYIANGNSWQGVDQRLERLMGPFPGFMEYTILDQNGQVVAGSNGRSEPHHTRLRGRNAGVPILARGEQVGTLLITPRIGDGRSGANDNQYPVGEVALSVARSFLISGLGLVTVLLLLAVLFARWFSRPLRRITAAAQELAAGRRDVQVSGASLREMDDLAQAFNSMAQALAAADQQRRQMTADVAHELRTPLTIIKGRLEGLQDGVYQATPDQIERLLNETALLERLIEDLRLLALAEAGQLPLHTELLNPRDMFEDSAAAFQNQARTQGVTLTIDAPDDLPLINADPQRMAQVLGNLLSNALRYTPVGGSITLRAWVAPALPAQPPGYSTPSSTPAASEAVVFEVIDTGQGIDAKSVPHIFERFWRADRSRTRESGGAGLGLAIVRQIVLAHSGTITAESAVGQGTTIRVTLPASNLADSATSDAPARITVE